MPGVRSGRNLILLKNRDFILCKKEREKVESIYDR